MKPKTLILALFAALLLVLLTPRVISQEEPRVVLAGAGAPSAPLARATTVFGFEPRRQPRPAPSDRPRLVLSVDAAGLRLVWFPQARAGLTER